jgi:hypothetical protein
MKVNTAVASVAALSALIGAAAHLGRPARHEGAPEAYPTRCVQVVLPNGAPLPRVCVVYPL